MADRNNGLLYGESTPLNRLNIRAVSAIGNYVLLFLFTKTFNWIISARSFLKASQKYIVIHFKFLHSSVNQNVFPIKLQSEVKHVLSSGDGFLTHDVLDD